MNNLVFSFNLILNIFFFSSLVKHARSEIIRELSQCFALKGTTIFKQGDIGNYYYILSEGSVELI